MPLARLAQYQHCLLRRNGVTTCKSGTQRESGGVIQVIEALRDRWRELKLETGIKFDRSKRGTANAFGI